MSFPQELHSSNDYAMSELSETTSPEYNKQIHEKSASVNIIFFVAAFICENSQLLNSVETPWPGGRGEMVME